ncbi:TetR/AcrR family transcriptional regulator C-terminal domain-containing protein [Kitasatospora sp. NPDC050463]|uniref:TetR/AcrR family transcriptional regulator C-terminal domain-containing protein n=1 Tax=Kitasatospora sp. NPDC050463 TaxID=3155786 RepID=UPI0033D8F188
MPSEHPYARIAAELRHRIETGELRPGERVPSTRALTQRWGVAMATATKALAVLRQEGLTRAVPGVGTVVCAAPRASRTAGRVTGRLADGPSEESAARRRLVRAGIAVADAEGAAALTMRRLAAELGTSAMSLYRHVQNRDQLLALMVDAAYAEARLPAPAPADWRSRLEVSARAQWGLYQAHPWLAAAMNLARPLLAPNGMRHVEWALAALEGLGLDANARMHAAVSLFAFVRGCAVDLAAEQEADRASGVTGDQWMQVQEARMATLLSDGTYPAFTAARADPGLDLSGESMFTFGLDRHLDGLAALIATVGAPSDPLDGTGHPAVSSDR